MTSPDEHKKSIREFLDDINEKVRAGTLFPRQKIVGFAVSEATVNLFELYLHQKRLTTEGFAVNHRFFASEQRAAEKFPFDFPQKTQILRSLVEIEVLTTRLCYGKSKKLEEVEQAVRLLSSFKKLVEKQLEETI